MNISNFSKFSYPDILESNCSKLWWSEEVNKFLGDDLKHYPAMAWANAEYILIHGCRTGRIFYEVLQSYQDKKKHTIHGLDPSPSMIHYANTHYGTNPEAFKWEKLALNDWKPPIYENNPEFPTLVKRVFSVHTLQFERDYKKLLKTIFDILFYSGALTGTIVVNSEIFELYNFLITHGDWKDSIGQDLVIPDWIQAKENSTSAKNCLHNVLEEVGFVDLNVELHKRSFKFTSIETCLEFYFAWNSAPLEKHIKEAETEHKLFSQCLEFLKAKNNHIAGAYEMQFDIVAFKGIKPKPWTVEEY